MTFCEFMVCLIEDEIITFSNFKLFMQAFFFVKMYR